LAALRDKKKRSQLFVAAVGLALLVSPKLALALDYAPKLSGSDDEALVNAINGSSTLVELKDKPPADIVGLYRRAREDLGTVEKAMRANGYYDGQVVITIDGRDAGQGAPVDAEVPDKDNKGHPLAVEIKVKPGTQYKITTIAIQQSGLKAPLKAQLNDGAPARSADILDERDRLLSSVMSQGYPFAKVELPPAVVDHATHGMSVTYKIEQGPPATLGAVTIKGLTRTNPKFVQRHVAPPQGQPYSPQALTAMRDELRTLDIFDSVKVTPATTLAPDGSLPVEIDVSERKPRFFGFGANYSTNDGAGLSAFWGHRNLFGNGERLRLQADISGFGENSLSETNYDLTGTFRRPDFLTTDQDLVSTIALTQQYDSDTFDKTAATADIGIERRLSKTVSITAGLEIEKSRITDHSSNSDSTQDFLLIGPTAGIKRDTSDDLLNPTRGSRLSFSATAFPTWLGSSEDVFSTQSSGAGYLNLMGQGDLVLAGRVAVANVFGSNLEQLPADRRLYAGGGGSVRGYKFRSISPRDSDNNLTGGRSSVETSVELRYRFLENYGIVPFFDAGEVSSDIIPTFDQPIQYAAGIGLRYYTSIGPIRADFAVPLNPTRHDDKFAFYISIGQAF
jgi:translocation and assembly module TamA